MKTRLQNDMRAAMKARDDVATLALRMAMTAVRNAEVAGKQARELSDEEVLKVLAKQAKQRREAAEAFSSAGHADRAERELAEERVLNSYLPEPLSPAELAAIVDDVFAGGEFTGPQDMGRAMKAVQAKVAGRADGKTVAAEVKARLST